MYFRYTTNASPKEVATFDADGLCFIPSSESPSIPGHVYGTTFTTRTFAETSVKDALGMAPILYREIAFWSRQDAVVVNVSSAQFPVTLLCFLPDPHQQDHCA